MSTVYFIQSGNDGPIKIGITSNVASRLYALQTSSPFPLRLLVEADGSTFHERRLHQHFDDERLEGEWFTPSPRLLGMIEAIKTGATLSEVVGDPDEEDDPESLFSLKTARPAGAITLDLPTDLAVVIALAANQASITSEDLITDVLADAFSGAKADLSEAIGSVGINRENMLSVLLSLKNHETSAPASQEMRARVPGPDTHHRGVRALTPRG